MGCVDIDLTEITRIPRWAKRNRKVKDRNLQDRIDLDREERGEL